MDHQTPDGLVDGPGAPRGGAVARFGSSRGVAPDAARALRLDVLGDLVAGAIVLGIAAVGVARLAGFGDAYPIKALVAYGAAGALILAGLPAHAPHARFGPANRLTLLRLAGGLLLGAAVGEPAFAHEAVVWGALTAAAVLALLDAVDGPIARASGMASRFGARFDMETDAWLMLVLGALLWQLGRTGAWVLAAGLMRYAFVAAARAWPWLGHALPPSTRRKAVCALAIAGLVACLGPIVPAAASAALAAACVLAIAGSFAVDVAWLARTRSAHPEGRR